MIKIFKGFFLISICLLLVSCNADERKVTIIFNTNGGSYLEPLEVSSGTEVNLPTPSREGYTFLGWTLDLENINILETALTIIENVTLYATWELLEVRKYYIEYVVDNEVYTKDYYASDEEIYLPNTEEIEGYIFDGWYLDQSYNTKLDFYKMGDKNLVLYGRYLLINDLEFNTFSFKVLYQDETSITLELIITGNVNFAGFSGVMLYSDNLTVESVNNVLGVIINNSEEGQLIFNYVNATNPIFEQVSVLQITLVKTNNLNYSIQLVIDQMIMISEEYEVLDAPFNIIQLP